MPVSAFGKVYFGIQGGQACADMNRVDREAQPAPAGSGPNGGNPVSDHRQTV